VLIPESSDSDYWTDVLKGVVHAKDEAVDYRVSVTLFQFDQYNRDSFVETSQRLMEFNPDGVLISPFFRREVFKLTKELEDRHIPFVFVDSSIDGVNNLAYYGQRSYQSGYMAARIMLNTIPKPATLLLVHMLRDGNHMVGSNQTARREEGFLAYLEKYSLENEYNLVRVNLHHLDHDSNEKLLNDVFEQNKNIHGIIMFNSRIYHMGNYLERHQIRGIRTIGYDLVERNVRFLKDGTVDCLIAQRPQLQGYYGIMALVKYLVLGQVPKRECYMPIDLLFKENIDDYKVYPFDVE
jgi:LacI family transcriptional regulator